MPTKADWMLKEICLDNFTIDTSLYDSETAEQREEDTVHEGTVLVMDAVTG